MDVSFTYGGLQSLKNIEDSLRVYHLAHGSEEVPPPLLANADPEEAQTGKPRVAVGELQVIGANQELEALVQGLRPGLLDGLAKSTALTVAASARDCRA